MNKKLKYFKVLGIEPTTDKAVIKRAYRKQAFLFHPDRNSSENAAKEFIRLAEAYEILMDDTWGVRSKSEAPPGKTAEEVMADRMKRAKERYYQAKAREREEEMAYYHSLISGRKGRLFKWFGIACAIFSVIWFIDVFFLPEQQTEYQIASYENTRQFVYLDLDGEEYVFRLGDMVPLLDDSSIKVFRSNLFNDLKYVYVNTYSGQAVKVIPRMAFIYFFPFINLLLLLPLLVFVLRKPTPVFTLLYMISKYGVSLIFILALFSRFRIFQIFF